MTRRFWINLALAVPLLALVVSGILPSMPLQHLLAIGIDVTTAMVERAKENAAKGGYSNVKFYQSTIDQTPLPDASVDCIISNCVINLAPDRPAMSREIVRALKPGGRVALSNIALKHELPEAVAQSMAAYARCIAGGFTLSTAVLALTEEN